MNPSQRRYPTNWRWSDPQHGYPSGHSPQSSIISHTGGADPSYQAPGGDSINRGFARPPASGSAELPPTPSWPYQEPTTKMAASTPYFYTPTMTCLRCGIALRLFQQDVQFNQATICPNCHQGLMNTGPESAFPRVDTAQSRTLIVPHGWGPTLVEGLEPQITQPSSNPSLVSHPRISSTMPYPTATITAPHNNWPSFGLPPGEFQDGRSCSGPATPDIYASSALNRPVAAGLPVVDLEDAGWQDLDAGSSSGATRKPVKDQVATPKSFQASQKRRSPSAVAKHVCAVPGCMQTFTKKHNLESHVRSHYGEKPYNCKWCGKVFGRINDCTRHESNTCKQRPQIPL